MVDATTLLFVNDDDERSLPLAQTHQGPVVATRYAVDVTLRAHGVETVDPSRLFKEAEKAAQLESILEFYKKLSRFIDSLELGAEEVSLLRWNGLRLIAMHMLFHSVIVSLNAKKIFFLERGKTHTYTIARAFHAISKIDISEDDNCASPLPRDVSSGSNFNEIRLLPGDWILDLRSAIARNTELKVSNILRLLPSKPRKASSHVIFSNLKKAMAALLGSTPRVVSYRLSEPHISPEFEAAIANIGHPTGFETEPELGHALEQLTRNFMLSTKRMERLLDKLAETLGSRLRGLQLNFSTSPMTAAAIAVCHRRGIPSWMGSHGNIVAHGFPARRAIAEIIAENGYNTFPNLTYTVPRSRFQMPRDTDRPIVCRPRLKPKQECEPSLSKGKPFHILLAPNFLIWPFAIPGITTSCFECVETVEFMAHAIAARDGFSLDIRIKTTVADVAKQANWESNRGVLPNHVSHLISLADNIGDSNLGSYRDAIRKADLVVTEGMTSVIYDAVEFRRPVLLLNVHRDRVPATPAASLSDLAASSAKRHPIYQAACDDNLIPLLERLRSLHDKAPLTDAEVAPIVWSQEV